LVFLIFRADDGQCWAFRQLDPSDERSIGALLVRFRELCAFAELELLPGVLTAAFAARIRLHRVGAVEILTENSYLDVFERFGRRLTRLARLAGTVAIGTLARGARRIGRRGRRTGLFAFQDETGHCLTRFAQRIAFVLLRFRTPRTESRAAKGR